MSNLVDHARRELERTGWFDADSDYNGMLGKAVLELIEKFAEQGHSGMSARITRTLFAELSDFKALAPLTDNPDEWRDVSEFCGGTNLWQNRRNSEAFSYDGGKTYYLLSEERRWIPFRIRCFIKMRDRIRPIYPRHDSMATTW